MKNIVVFCGSASGSDIEFETQAYALGAYLAQHGMGLVYGGAKVGLMGAVANGVLKNGGTAIGVLPHFLSAKEIRHEALSQMIMVDTMHERKAKMNELADGVITLPGGFGTMEELFEMLTWAQLGLHQKPIGILNTNGYYDDLIALLQNMMEKGLLKKVNLEMLLVDASIDGLIKKMKAYQAPDVPKWVTKEDV